MRESVDLEALYPLIREVIDAGGAFRLYATGISMEPMIVAGKDSVSLIAADNPKIGDILLYRRKNGEFILHRLIAFDRDTLSFSGDRIADIEDGINPTDILAKLGGYYKGDEYISADSETFRKYADKCVKRFPFYVRNRGLHRFLRKVKRTIIK